MWVYKTNCEQGKPVFDKAHLWIRLLSVITFIFVTLISFTTYAQDVPQDSLKEVSQDSISAKFNQQANANKLSLGMDTTVLITQDTVVVDSLKSRKVRKSILRASGNRRFYWSPSQYNTSDSSLAAKKLRRHSPLYAALFSAALPGLGQAYNRKYWKIPIVYAGLGGLGYACYYTATNFTGYRNAYRAQVATVPDQNASYKGVSDPATLKTYRDYFKKNLDISAICTGVWYFLNIVDATVDAHLFEWNMKDDIHLSWQPVMMPNTYQASTTPGVRLNLSF